LSKPCSQNKNQHCVTDFCSALSFQPKGEQDAAVGACGEAAACGAGEAAAGGDLELRLLSVFCSRRCSGVEGQRQAVQPPV